MGQNYTFAPPRKFHRGEGQVPPSPQELSQRCRVYTLRYTPEGFPFEYGKTEKYRNLADLRRKSSCWEDEGTDRNTHFERKYFNPRGTDTRADKTYIFFNRNSYVVIFFFYLNNYPIFLKT